MNASYINMYLEEKSVHVVKHQKSYFLSISCKYFYTRIFRTHILYTLTTAARHAHNDRKRFVPNKILEGKPIPRSFHSFALEMKLFDSPFFCLSTLWSNSEWAITISPGFFFLRLLTFVLIWQSSRPFTSQDEKNSHIEQWCCNAIWWSDANCQVPQN